MLRKRDVRWVKRNLKLRIEYPKKPLGSKQRQHYYRLRRKTEETLQGLTTLLEILPEQQSKQTFNRENVGPFLKALFSLKGDDIEERRKRILELWHFMLIGSGHSGYRYVADLVGEDYLQLLTEAGINPIQALYVVASSTSSRLRK